MIPHTHAAGDDGAEIPVYVRTPRGAKKEAPVPVVLLITGLDGHRPDNAGVGIPLAGGTNVLHHNYDNY